MASRALIIGPAVYGAESGLATYREIANSRYWYGEVLKADERWGEGRVVVLPEDELQSVDGVLEAIQSAADDNNPGDTLLVIYVGHGAYWSDLPAAQVHLAVGLSRAEAPHTWLSSWYVYRAMEKSQDTLKVLIADCGNSDFLKQLGLDGPRRGGGSPYEIVPGVLGMKAWEGTCVLATGRRDVSAGGCKTLNVSMQDQFRECTAFSGHLLNLLWEGTLHADGYLTLGMIHDMFSIDMEKCGTHGRPRMILNDARDGIPLFSNRRINPGTPRARPPAEPRIADPVSEDPALILRVYVPVGRLYAPEEGRVLSLFREWLAATHKIRIKEGGYQTASGKVYEFYAERPGLIDLTREVEDFSGFFTQCVIDPAAATECLTRTGLDHSFAAQLTNRYGREVRRLNLDLRQEREKRIMALRHEVEADLLDVGYNTGSVDPEVMINQIRNLVETLAPGPLESAVHSVLEAGNRSEAPLTIIINQQKINSVEGHVFQNVRGTLHFGPKAQDLLAAVRKYGGQEATLLETAVHEVEDTDAPRESRRAARKRLVAFLQRLGQAVQDVAVDVLEKYLESKVG